MKDKNVIELMDIESKVKTIYVTNVTIEGTTDLVLNKMNSRNTRMLVAEDRKKIRESANVWEDIITAIHWRDGIPVKDTYTECTEELFKKMLTENAPCISAFGLKKSFGDAVVRNEIDKYKTKFDNAVNVVAERGLVPITFSEWSLDERLMAPKKGAPVTVRLSHFTNWKATFRIDFTDNVYKLENIVNIINLAGFGLGIGSGRSSGYGRYKVISVE